MDKEYILVAFCNKPHGVRGEIKVTPYLDDNANFKKLDELYCKTTKKSYKVKRIFQIKDCYGIGLEGINTFEDAMMLKGQELFALKSQVESMIGDDRIFIEDLIGLTAVFSDGTVIGEIDDIVNYGASDIVFIKSEKYKNLSFANVGGIFDRINEEDQTVVLNKEEFEKVCIFDK